MADLRITVLVENTAGGRGLLGEHGLSFWIEIGARRVLFDTGQGRVLLGNSERLGIRPETADAVVLSHGHYDHTGGLQDVLQRGGRVPVYAHLSAFEAKYARNRDGTSREIGLPPAARDAISERAELIRVDGPAEIAGGLRLTGPVPRETDFEDTGGPFFADADCTRPDELTDDQAAFVDTPHGTVVVLGCAHAGVVNTLRHVRNLTGGRPIHTVLGGMHLVNASPERMDRTMEELRRLAVGRLLPCHCTGFSAAARLWREFPGRCGACAAGTVIEI